jgi:hypothetical protein
MHFGKDVIYIYLLDILIYYTKTLLQNLSIHKTSTMTAVKFSAISSPVIKTHTTACCNLAVFQYSKYKMQWNSLTHYSRKALSYFYGSIQSNK